MTDQLANAILGRFDDVLAELQNLRQRLDSMDSPTKPQKKNGLLTIRQASQEFNISTRTLYRLKPLHVKFGRAVRIRRQDLENYLRADLFGKRHSASSQSLPNGRSASRASARQRGPSTLKRSTNLAPSSNGNGQRNVEVPLRTTPASS